MVSQLRGRVNSIAGVCREVSILYLSFGPQLATRIVTALRDKLVDDLPAELRELLEASGVIVGQTVVVES